MRPRHLALRDAGEGTFDDMLAAIDDEIAAVERDAARNIDISEGRRLHVGPGGALYTARAELSMPLVSETPIVLVTDTSRSRGTLVAVEDFDLLVHLDDDLGRSFDRARITTEPAFILEALRDRLVAVVTQGDSGLPTAGSAGALTGMKPVVSGSNDEAADHGAAELAQLADAALHPNPAQLRAMSRVAGSNLHFVWGPPGTGKTAALAQIARMLVSEGERVLVLAHANVAVDVAMLRIADAFDGTKELADGHILRLGQPHHPEALTRDEILVDAVLARKSPELAIERDGLERRRREIAAGLRASSEGVPRDELAAELRRIRERLAVMREQVKEQTAQLVRDATVVGATLSRFVLSNYLWEWSPQAILLDEASMVSFPWVLAAAIRTQKRLIVLGDFRQLPPVYQAQSKRASRWLARDAFEVAGVRERVDAGVPDDRVTLLDTQYRMARPVAEVVSNLAYGGALRTDSDAAVRASRFVDARPWPSEALVVVDTTGLFPAGQVDAKAGSFSRVNPVHALLALSLASAARERQTALISPYRAQARLLAAGVRGLGLTGAEAATIHRFQGSERELVIFDLVDAPPLEGPSRLTGTDLDLALRLANVGISRARGKAVVLTHRELVENRFAPNSPVRRALELCAAHGKIVAPSLVDVQALNSSEIEWMGGEDMLRRLQEDLGAANFIIGNLPSELRVDEDLLSAMGELASRGGRLIIHARPDVVSKLDRFAIDLRLMVRPSFFVSIDRSVAYVGGAAPHLGARVSSPVLTEMLESLLFGDVEHAKLALERSRSKAHGELPPSMPQLPDA